MDSDTENTQLQSAPGSDSKKRTIAVLANLLVYWISRHWLALANLAVAVFIGLPFLAPVLMHAGYEGPAHIIYKVYSPACHQMGFRSWYLYGEQLYYPLEEADIQSVRSFEEYVQTDPAFVGMDPHTDFFGFSWKARSFVGNDQMGYKVALCQRDVATYMGLLGAGLLFALLRRRIGSLPWQIFVFLGILPMLIDGGYQLLSYMFPFIIAPHETTPLLRTITGAMFGIALIWLTYPQIDIGMTETADELQRKLVRAKIIRGKES